MKARAAFLWTATAQVYSFVLNFGGSVILARLLTPTEVGTFVIGVAAVGIITAFTALGIGAYIIREPELTDAVLDTAFTLNGMIVIGLAIVIAAVGQMSEWLLGSSDAGRVLTVLALTPLMGLLSFRPATMLQRELRFKAIAVVNTIAVSIGTITTVTCAVAGQSYMSMAWGALASTATSLIGFTIVGRRHVGFGVGLMGWRRMLAFGARMVTISGAASITARLADVILGRLLGLRSLGLYSRASNLSSQIFDNIYGTATRIVFSHLSQQYRETGDISHGFLKSFRLITSVMWPLLFGLAILSPVLIQTLYGEKWLAAAAPLSILLLAQVVALFFGMNWELFVIKDETALQTRIELARGVLGLSIFTIGCMISLTAAALGRLCDNLLAVALYRKHVTRLSGVAPGDLHAAYRQGMLLSLCAAAPAGILMLIEHWSANTPLVLVGAAVSLGVACWGACLLYIRHPLVDEISAVLGGLKRRFDRSDEPA